MPNSRIPHVCLYACRASQHVKSAFVLGIKPKLSQQFGHVHVVAWISTGVRAGGGQGAASNTNDQRMKHEQT